MWLARNKDGKLFIWRIKPIKIGGKWGLGIRNQCSAYIPNDNYPFIEPQEVDAIEFTSRFSKPKWYNEEEQP